MGEEAMENQVHGHEVMRMMIEQGTSYTRETLRDAMVEKFGDPDEAGLVWKPNNTTELDEEKAQTLMKLLDSLDDCDDVQRVAANYDIADEIMEWLTA